MFGAGTASAAANAVNAARVRGRASHMRSQYATPLFRSQHDHHLQRRRQQDGGVPMAAHDGESFQAVIDDIKRTIAVAAWKRSLIDVDAEARQIMERHAGSV